MRKQKNEKENKPWDTEHVSTMSRVAWSVRTVRPFGFIFTSQVVQLGS